MDKNIYGRIVNNSKFLYLYVKTILDKCGKIKDFEILDINKTVIKKVNLVKEDILNTSLTTLLTGDYNWIEIIKEAMQYENYNKIHYIDNLNDWYEIDIEKVNQTELYIIMNKAYKFDEYTQKLLDVFPAGIWYKDKEGRYITSSNAMLFNDRVKDRNIKGKTDLEIQKSKKAAENVMNLDFKVIQNMSNMEYNTMLSNNRVHSLQKHCVNDDNGNVLGTLGFYLDVTAHEQLKEDYKNYKKLSDSLLQSIPDMLVYKNIQGKYEYCNKSCLNYLGLNDERDIIGKYDDEMPYDNKFEKDFIIMTDKVVLESKKQLRYTTNPTKEGREYYFDIIKTPYLNECGEVLGITAMIRDITNLVKAKNKLKENEEQLSTILNGISDVIILSDKNKIIYVNEAFEDVFGINRAEYLKNPNIIEQLFTDEYKKLLGDYYHEVDYNIEININTRDGKNKWIWYKGYLLDKQNLEGKKITIIRDITAKKEYDMELERLKVEFFSNITHELRTPLNLIFSSLQLIDLKVNTNKNYIEDYVKYIDIIKQNSLRLLKLVNNLIDSTKIDAGYLSCKYDNVDIVRFVEHIFNSIENYAKSKNIQLIFDTNTEEKIVSLDMDKLERIILNILSNAIKFNKEYGKIYLFIKISDEDTVISIKDTGIGIPEHKLESIFDRFIQVNNRMTKISEGSGIGLSLSKSLVEMLGGNIKVNSTLDEGSEFIITIPNIIRDDIEINNKVNEEYNSFVKKSEIEFSDLY